MKIDIIGKDNHSVSSKQLNIPVFAMGFTARNTEQMKKNLKALENQGIKYPNSFPQVYPCQRYILSDEREIEVVSDKTCGEVEFLLLILKEGIFIGVGSDHADKEIEKISIIKSKQLCAKHYANAFWRYEDVKDHWDRLILRSYQRDSQGEYSLYQEGEVKNILTPESIMSFLEKEGILPDKEAIIFSGSVAAIGGTVYGEKFRYELEDPVLQRKICSEYDVLNIAAEKAMDI